MVLFHPRANLRIHPLRLGLSRSGKMAASTCEEGTILASTAPTASTMANSAIRAHS